MPLLGFVSQPVDHLMQDSHPVIFRSKDCVQLHSAAPLRQGNHVQVRPGRCDPAEHRVGHGHPGRVGARDAACRAHRAISTCRARRVLGGCILRAAGGIGAGGKPGLGSHLLPQARWGARTSEQGTQFQLARASFAKHDWLRNFLCSVGRPLAKLPPAPELPTRAPGGPGAGARAAPPPSRSGTGAACVWKCAPRVIYFRTWLPPIPASLQLILLLRLLLRFTTT